MASVQDSVREHAVVRELVAFLRREGYRVRLEVPNMGQSADLVATRGRWAMFVEAKVADWRRALEQCRAHQQVADFVCVAIATLTPSASLLGEATRLGYGVIHCEPDSLRCRWALRPRLNKRVWPPQRRQWAKAIRAVSYAH